MPAECEPNGSAVAVLDLRECADAVQVRSAVRVADTPALPADLMEQSCSVLLVFSTHDDPEQEQSLRARVAPTGVQVCWVRIPASSRPFAQVRERVDRLESLVEEASSVLRSLSAGLDETEERNQDPAGLDLAVLSARERDVLTEVRCGHSNKQIGQKLCVSPHTVGNHLRAIYRKLGVSGRHELLARLAQR